MAHWSPDSPFRKTSTKNTSNIEKASSSDGVPQQTKSKRENSAHPSDLPLTFHFIPFRFKSDGWFYTLWDFFIPAYSCPFPVSRIGNLGDGGKFVCAVDRVIERPNCVIYSLGVSGDSSFEASLLSRFPNGTCQVYGPFLLPILTPPVPHPTLLRVRLFCTQCETLRLPLP